MSELSRDHIRHYGKRERREIEEFRAEAGGEAATKLDLITLRDVLAGRRAHAFDELFADTPGPEARRARFRVMVNRRTGRTAAARVRVRTRRDRLLAARSVQQRGQRLTHPIVESIEERDGEVERSLWLTHSVVARVDEETLVELANRRDVKDVNHTKKMLTLSLDVSRPLVQADQVENNLGITGLGVDVAILDTGIDNTHAELAVVSQQDFTGEGVGDFHGHGSHCAGIAAGSGGLYRGMAPGANLHDYKLMDQFGASDPPTAINAIQQAVADGRDVLSNSWGFSHRDGAWVDPDGTCVLCTAADNAAATSVFVVAAGNEDSSSCGTYDTWLRCPGLARDAITVGASDDDDDLADFSSCGPTPDQRCKPDVVAPGVDIVSARSSMGSDMQGQANVIDPTHVEVSGTSQACPHVAGIVALMLETNAALTSQNVKDILMATAVDIGADRCSQQGAGRVDALAAVNASST